MTVQAADRNRWLLRVLLVAAAGLLLTVLWFSTAVRASAQDEVAGDGAVDLTTAPAAPTVADAPPDGLEPPGNDPVTPVADEVAPEPAPPTDVPAPFAAVEEVLDPAPPLVEEAPPEVVPAPEVPEPPVEETAVEAVAPVAPTVEARVAAAVAEPLVLSPVLDASLPLTSPQPVARRVHTAERHPSTPAVAAADPAAPVAEVDPCPPVAPPVVATARPVRGWSHGLDGGGGPGSPDDPAPVAVSPPSVEHARGGTSRGDDPRPSDGQAAGLPAWASTATSSGRSGPDGALPSDVEPPQLRVLSSRAGPCPGHVPAPDVEILDLPA